MGYDVHITRKEEWFSEEGDEISLDEWKAYVESDPEIRLDGFAEAANPAGVAIRIESPGLAVWTAYSGNGSGGNMAWFSHYKDRITVKNPDEEILTKMHAIASALGARVQGDEGELYDPSGRPIAQEPQHRSVTLAVSPKSPWWKFW